MKRILLLLTLVLALGAGSVFAAGYPGGFNRGPDTGFMGVGCGYGQPGWHHGGYGYGHRNGWNGTYGRMGGAGWGHGPQNMTNAGYHGYGPGYGMGPGAISR